MALRRGLAVVVAIIAMALIVSIGGLLILYMLVSREPTVARNSLLVLRVGGALPEAAPEDVVNQFVRGRREPTVRAIVDNIRKAKVDRRITGLLVVPTGIGSPYWGKLQEIREAVVDFRGSGKKTAAYLEYGGDREYYVATGCERIYLMPTSPLDVDGVASYELFLRGTLDKIGAYPDMHHIGDYKTATNTLTQEGFTPQHREMAESLNREAYEQLVRAIAEGRRKKDSDVRALIDNGPFLPEDAVRLGLVDDVAYEDEVIEKAEFGPSARDVKRIEGDEYGRISPRSLGLDRGPRIAVLYVVGMITSGRSGYDPTSGPVSGSDTVVEYIRQIRDDPSVRALVLRIDSPGGSSVASDVIWRELKLFADTKRPIVTSMSDLAASGGYYLAMTAPDIVAQPGTLTGSIGIYGGKIVTGGTFKKLGANIEGVSIGRNAEMNSPTRPYNPEELVKVEEQLQAFYDQFVEKVAEARHKTPEAVDAIAQGRVWTGRQARSIGLVDDLGGLQRAIGVAKQRAKIGRQQQVELVVYPPRRSLLEMIAEPFGGMDEAASLAALLGMRDQRALAALTAPLRLFRRGEPLALMPFTFVR